MNATNNNLSSQQQFGMVCIQSKTQKKNASKIRASKMNVHHFRTNVKQKRKMNVKNGNLFFKSGSKHRFCFLCVYGFDLIRIQHPTNSGIRLMNDSRYKDNGRRE